MKRIIVLLTAVFCVAAHLSFGEIYVGNAGFPGDATTQGLVRMYKDVLSFKPKAVVVMFGTNDFANPQCCIKPEVFEKNLELIVGKCRRNGVQEVVLMTPPPIIESVVRTRSPKLPQILPPGMNVNQYLEVFCEKVRRVAKAKGTRLIDMNDLFNKNGGATTDAKCLLRNPINSGANDGTHPTIKGYQFMADNVASVVKPLLKDGDVVICFGDSITYGSHTVGCGTANGDCYPAKLWRHLNPTAEKDAKASTLPSETYVECNMVRNPNMEFGDEGGAFPLSWIFWKKGGDTCEWLEGNAHSGTHFLRLKGSPSSEAVARTDMIMVNPKRKYRFSTYVRGSGKLDYYISIYYPPTPKLVKTVELTNQWQKVEGTVEVPGGFGQCCIIFKTRGQVDFDTADLRPDDETATVHQPQIRLLKLNSDKRIDAETVSMTFSKPEEGAAILSVENRAGVKFTNNGIARGLFNIRLKKIEFNPADYAKIKGLTFDPEQDYGAAGKSNDCESDDDLLIDASDVVKLGGNARVVQIPNGFRYEFKSIDVRQEKGALDVFIDVVKGEDGGIAFMGSFENRSKLHTVFFFTYPQVDGLGGIHGKSEDDYLAYPMYLGRLIKNPTSGKLYKTNMIFRSNNSGHSMHFDALYNNGDGLFFHVKDPVQYAKRWLLRSDKATGMMWSVCNVPDNMRVVPQMWQVPYPIEISCFKGDWYDAARKYRKWALKQYWCEKGTIVEREKSGDLKKWFIEMDDWAMGAVLAITQFNKQYFDAFFKEFSEFKIGVWLLNWGHDNNKYDFPNPDRFPLTEMDKVCIKSLHDRSIPMSAYIQTTGWSMDKPIFKNTPNAEKCLVRNYYGQILAWGTSGLYGQAAIAYPGEPWRKILVGVTGEMVRAGFDTVYMDSGNHGGFYLNFNPDFSSHTGGGNDYVMGIQKLLKEVRNEGRKINPRFSITAESFWEGNLNTLDAVLTVNSPNFYLEGDRVTAIPLAPVVYHDHAICYCTHYAKRDMVNDKAAGYVAKSGQELVWGIKSGWDLVHWFYDINKENPEILRSMAYDRFSAYRMALKYLVYGTMLRPPTVDYNGSRMIKWTRNWSDEDYSVIQPDVLTSAWKAPDGTLGIVLYNTSTLPWEGEISLKDAEYESQKREYSILYPDKKKFSLNADKTSMHIVLPSRRFIIIEGK